MYTVLYNQTDLEQATLFDATINETTCSIRFENQSKYTVDIYNGTQLEDRVQPFSYTYLTNGDYTVKVNKDIASDNTQTSQYIGYKAVTGQTTDSTGMSFNGTMNVEGNMNVTNSSFDVVVTAPVEANISNSELTVNGSVNAQIVGGNVGITGPVQAQITSGSVNATIENAKIDTNLLNAKIGTNDLILIGTNTVQIQNSDSPKTVTLPVSASDDSIFNKIIVHIKSYYQGLYYTPDSQQTIASYALDFSTANPQVTVKGIKPTETLSLLSYTNQYINGTSGLGAPDNAKLFYAEYSASDDVPVDAFSLDVTTGAKTGSDPNFGTFFEITVFGYKSSTPSKLNAIAKTYTSNATSYYTDQISHNRFKRGTFTFMIPGTGTYSFELKDRSTDVALQGDVGMFTSLNKGTMYKVIVDLNAPSTIANSSSNYTIKTLMEILPNSFQVLFSGIVSGDVIHTDFRIYE